jgi:peptidoglycan/LPS O-acetylase OafA/YrhL
MIALWVVIFHLLNVPVIGPYAVFSFFILSGFLMTTIMHESYGHTITGMKSYAINRFLRLYPMYWVAILITLTAIMISGPEYAKIYKQALSIPKSLTSILENISMLFMALIPYEVTPRLSPPTWALTIEIFFYILIALGISRNIQLTLTWVGASIFFYLYSYIVGLDGSLRYASVFGASLPFSLGALLYFYKNQIFFFMQRNNISNPWCLMGIYTFNAVTFSLNAHFEPFDNSLYLHEGGKYLNILLTMLVVISLFFRGSEIFNRNTDKLIGAYSYPIYLIHWQCGLLASYILFDQPQKGLTVHGLLSLCLALFFVWLFSYLMIYGIDNNISRIRNKIRGFTTE